MTRAEFLKSRGWKRWGSFWYKTQPGWESYSRPGPQEIMGEARAFEQEQFRVDGCAIGVRYITPSAAARKKPVPA